MGVSGVGATSYMGYYTNVHWLQTLYRKNFSSGDSDIQKALYIDGIGTEAGKPDNMIGQGLGISDTGVIAKTDKAIRLLAKNISDSIGDIKSKSSEYELVIKSLQFDIFGFSRGAAASRHFANRIHSEDPAIIAAIRDGIQDTEFKGAPAGKIRFIGIFDTVAAIGTPLNGLNPHNSNTGDVNLILRPGVADKVFHITAAHECRFNFALNSVKPAWPELALPGAHSDIGGGYLPAVEENL
ncbi:phospholipase effector Tle1 domain-containing protein, partial [bacterium BS0013]